MSGAKSHDIESQMNLLKMVSNQRLVEILHGLVSEERKLLTRVLEHLAEVYRRRLYLEMGYSSLFTFCVKELGYTESQSQRRVLAMRAIALVPELENRLESGKVSLATVSLAQAHLLAIEKVEGAKVGLTERTQLFEAIEDKSKKEVESYLATQAASHPKLAKKIFSQRESVRPMGSIDGEPQFELRINVSKTLLDKLRQIQALSSHTGKTDKLADVLDYMSESVLHKIDPERISLRVAQRNSTKVSNTHAACEPQSTERTVSSKIIGPLEKTFPGKLGETSDGGQNRTQMSRRVNEQVVSQSKMSIESQTERVYGIHQPRRQPIARSIQREVFRRDGSCCTYSDSTTGRRCGETRYLEIDHQKPVALGGDNSVDNLRLRCRPHNILAAVQNFGTEKMSKYLG